MTKETAEAVAKNLSENYVPIINKVLKNRLGIIVNMIPYVHYGRYDNYVYLKCENENEVNNKMRANKLLRYLFKSAHLEVSTWFNEEEKSFGFRVSVYYEHYSGSNGHDLFTFYIMCEDKKVVYNKWNPKVN